MDIFQTVFFCLGFSSQNVENVSDVCLFFLGDSPKLEQYNILQPINCTYAGNWVILTNRLKLRKLRIVFRYFNSVIAATFEHTHTHTHFIAGSPLNTNLFVPIPLTQSINLVLHFANVKLRIDFSGNYSTLIFTL